MGGSSSKGKQSNFTEPSHNSRGKSDRQTREDGHLWKDRLSKAIIGIRRGKGKEKSSATLQNQKEDV